MKYLGNKVGNGLALGKVYIINTKIPELKEKRLATLEELTKEKEELKEVLDSVVKDYEELEINVVSDDIKQFSYEICQKHKAVIRYMETDQDHIHYMIETEPAMSISKIVNLMKSYTTYHIWEKYPNYLRKHFRKEHTFWTDGYFACSVGSVSEEMLRKYIENQG